MQAMVVYSSRTGNTQKIASEIFRAIPGESKDMQHISEYTGKDADLFFVGFWTRWGDCDTQIANLLSGFHGKRIALFGTCGVGGDGLMHERIIRQVKGWIAPDNSYAGTFLCQGKMPMEVRRRYEAKLSGKDGQKQVRAMLRNFDEALLHPDPTDLADAAAFVRSVMEQDVRLRTEYGSSLDNV